MARIKTIDYKDSSGKLKIIYDNLIDKRGKLANVHKIQSLRPQSIKAHMDLYMEIMYSRSKLSRAERELIGTAVSISNGCNYCATHHAEALNHYWKDEQKIKKLLQKKYSDVLSQKELKMINFAIHLTDNPGDHENENFVKSLEKSGFADDEILDIVLVTAYFNFVNRIVLSLGVALEENGGDGYKY